MISPYAIDRCDSQMEATDPGDRLGSHAEIFVELRDQMSPAASQFLRKPCQIDVIRGLLEYPPCMEQTHRRDTRGRQSCSDYAFYDVKPGGPVVCGLRMAREQPRKSAIDILQRKRTIRKQVHRRPQKHLCADWSEANHHKVPSSEGLADLMAMLQSYDPCVSVLGCALPLRWVDASMRSSEVQHDRDFTWWQVPLMQWPRQEALTREVTKDVVAEARLGRPLCSQPATEIRSVAADFDTG
jgi:hypothetical protein